MALPKIEVQVTADTAQAAASLDRLIDELAAVGQAGETAGKDVASLKRDFDRLRGSIDPVCASSKAYEKTLRTVSAAVKSGATSQAEANRVLALAEAQFTGTGQAAQIMGRQMRGATAHTTNLMFQFQDIAMMLAAGQNPLMLAMQQGTQVSGVFQQMKNSGQSAFKGIVGGLAAMASPMSLMTIGVIAGGAALVQWAVSAATAEADADDLAEKLTDLASSANSYAAALEQASMSTVDLVSKYGMQAAELQRIYDLNVALQKIQLQQTIREFSAQVGATYSGLGDDLERIVELSKAATETTMRQSTAQDMLSSAISGLKDEYGLAVGQALDLARAIDQMSSAVTMDEHAAAATAFGEALVEAQKSGATIPPEMVRLAIEAGASASAIRDLEAALYDAADAASTIRIPGQGGGGRGDPRQFTNVDEFRKQLSDQDAWKPKSRPKGRSGGGGGGGATDPNQARIESLVDSLKTERETVDEWRAEGMDLLAMANEAELAALGGHNEAKLRLENEYQSKLKGIKDEGLNGNLAIMKDFFGEGAQLMQSGNEKLFQIGKAFAIAEAVVSGISSAQAAWEKGMQAGGPPLAAAYTALSVANSAARISALKSASSSGGGGGGGGAGASSSPQGASQQPLDVRVSGLSSGQLMDGMDVGRLLERLQDEAGDRGLRITVAR